MNAILGIDIAKDKFDCCLLLEEGQSFEQFDNNRRGFAGLKRWLKRRGLAGWPQLRACMEATGVYGQALLEWLFAQGCAVARVNPAQVKHYARSLLARHKTDRQDALLIAQFARERSASGLLRLWQPPAPELKELRALTRLLARRKQQLADEQRRAHCAERCLRAHINRSIRARQKEIGLIQRQIDAVIAGAPELRRKQELLLSIPAIGPVTAAIFLAELPPDIQSARQAAAYAGLTPQREDSGQKRGRARLSKTGNPHLRKAFYMPAVTGRRFNPRLKASAARWELAGLAPKQTIGACMHLLLRLCFGVLRSGQAFQEDRPGRPPGAKKSLSKTV